MHDLPKNLDLDELIGQEINLVSVGPYDAQIAFEKGVVIHAFYKMEAEISGVRKIWFNEKWVRTSEILNVPKQKVLSVNRESDLVFSIQLSNDIVLFFHTEVSQYESLNICWPNGTMEVI